MDYINKIIGSHIKKTRLGAGKTRQDVSKAIGISYNQIHKYETGVNRISLARLHEISKVLGIDIVKLIPEEIRKHIDKKTK